MNWNCNKSWQKTRKLFALVQTKKYKIGFGNERIANSRNPKNKETNRQNQQKVGVCDTKHLEKETTENKL